MGGTILVERLKELAEQRLRYSTNMHGACCHRSRPIVYADCGSRAAVSVTCQLNLRLWHQLIVVSVKIIHSFLVVSVGQEAP